MGLRLRLLWSVRRLQPNCNQCAFAVGGRRTPSAQPHTSSSTHVHLAIICLLALTALICSRVHTPRARNAASFTIQLYRSLGCTQCSMFVISIEHLDASKFTRIRIIIAVEVVDFVGRRMEYQMRRHIEIPLVCWQNYTKFPHAYWLLAKW